MSVINAYLTKDALSIKQTRVKRNWMDNTYDAHAYHCFPISLANSIGYELSAPEDITFIWDGVDDSSADHVKILNGDKWCYAGRANASLSFNSGIIFKTENNISMLHMPVPNYFNNSYQTFTSIISTSFYDSFFPVAIKITKANEEITIKAGDPIVTLLPISLTDMSNIELELNNYKLPQSYFDYHNKRNEVSAEIIKSGKWTDWYRDAIDYDGKSIGNHEVKSLKLKIKDNRNSNG